VNEIRQENDLKPIEGGDIILDSVFLQGKQADAQAAQDGSGSDEMGGGDEDFDGFDDGDVDGMVDDAMKDMEKAVRLI